jgi:cyclohexanecarboxylate-CoA ligase
VPVQIAVPAERGQRERAAGAWLDRFVDGYVAEAARLVPEKPVIIDGLVTVTYAEANRAIDAVARALHRLGVRRGDVVSWQLPNWHEAFLLHHAILRAAAVSNPIVPIYRRHEVEYMLREAGSRVLVIPETFRGFDHVAMAAQLRPGLPDLEHVVVVRPQQPTQLSFAELTRAAGPPLDAVRSPDDPMLLMFTSGTTARPKGVLHTHNTLDYENRSIIEIFDLRHDDTVFMPSPLSHITGLLYGIQLPAMLKTAAVLQDVWEPRRALALLAEHRCTVTVAATPFLHGLTHHRDRAQFDLSALRLFACGGADVPPGLVRDARTLLGCYVTRIYGSTEVPTLSTTSPHDPPVKAAQTDGRVIGGASYRIVDDGGDPVTDGVIGHLEAKGPETFVGYLRREDAADAFTPDGWFRTGDLASADSSGFLSIRGRSKDIVLRGGENISVTEIEELLFEHPDVVEVAIVAMPDPVMVERACAFVVPRDGARPTLAELVAFLDARGVAKQKYPERLELVPELPKTQSGKIQKFLLRQQIRRLIERTPVNPTELLDPAIAKAIQAFPFEALTDEQVAMIRSVELPSVVSDAVERTDHVLPGEPAVSVRVHRPKGVTGPLPCVYSIHGGGYVIGSNAMDDALFDQLCPALELVGVSVEYRLAPEAPYPGPLEDCYRGLLWTHEHADELGIDRRRVGVRGISAGGGLAAALALLVRDRAEVSLAFQLLDCPMLDDRQLTFSSQVEGLPVWSRDSNTFGWRAYLGDLYGGADVPYTAAPARAQDLSNLPPAYVSVGTVDGFLDEDVDYATRLNHAGVPTELHVYPGACHGYQMAVDSEITAQSQRDARDWLRRQLGR